MNRRLSVFLISTALLTLILLGKALFLAGQAQSTLLWAESYPVQLRVSKLDKSNIAIRRNDVNAGLPTVQLSSATYTVNENAGAVVVTFLLSHASTQHVTVDFATNRGTANDGEDYERTSGTIGFGPGMTSTTLDTLIINDIISEGNETFNLVLTSPSGATLGVPNTAVITIIDNDQPAAFSCNNVTEIPKTECDALVALSNSTSGPNWLDHTDWLATNTPCSWYGITCNAGHVAELFLYNNQLNGTIPSDLSNLHALQKLNLSFNGLNGNIPPQLGSLSNLLELTLAFNQLSGNIPVELSNISSLEYIDLTSNQLGGTFPPTLGSLNRLSTLLLSKNQLSGSVPSELGNLVNLQYLYLDNNLFGGTLPSNLVNLTSLTHFWYQNTGLCEPVDTAFQTWLVNIGDLNRTGVLCAALPSAEFDAWPQSGNTPLTVAMHIVSTTNISNCAWEYGDGQTGNSCAAYHDHTYTAAGTYTVKLTMSSPGGSDTKTRNNYITVFGQQPSTSTPTSTSTNTSIPTSTAIGTATPVPPINTLPVANNQSITTVQNTGVNIQLTATDTDNDSLTYIFVSNPNHGILSGTSPNLIYTPSHDFNGADSFTFKVNDGQADSNIATINITITPSQPRITGVYLPLIGGRIEEGIMTIDDQFTTVAERTPGFGGMYADEEVNILYVYMREGDSEAAVAAIRDVFKENNLPSNVQVLQAAFDFLQLKQWHDLMAEHVFKISGVSLTDINDTENRLLVGVENQEAKDQVERKLIELGIPAAAVNIVEVGAVRFVLYEGSDSPLTNLTDFHRPLVGGLQIQLGLPGGYETCSFGFIAIRKGIRGFVTNAHCSPTRGQVDQTVYYQPLLLDVGGEPEDNYQIGVETVDTPFQPCLLVFNCRYSDSLFGKLEAAPYPDEEIPADLGFIARPALNSVAWDGVSTFRITHETHSVFVGQRTTMVGRTSGRTEGRVLFTGVTKTLAGGRILKNQVLASYKNAAGDSGAPVISTPSDQNGNPVDTSLLGINWGDIDFPIYLPPPLSSRVSVFSPIGSVEADLGSLNTCAPPYQC